MHDPSNSISANSDTMFAQFAMHFPTPVYHSVLCVDCGYAFAERNFLLITQGQFTLLAQPLVVCLA